jgi:hypothetical protein
MLQEFLDLISLEKEISQLRKEAGVLRGVIADKICPYKVGEITTVKGYSHEKKNCKITDVTFKYTPPNKWGADVDLIIHGVVLKKDGSESLNRVDWKDHNDPILEHILDPLKEYLKQNTTDEKEN